MTRARAFILGASILLLSPAGTSASGLDVRLGGFEPRGHSNLFTDADELFGVRPRDFRGFTGGAEWSIGAGDHIELGFHLDGYGRVLETSYVDYDYDDGTPIFQDLKLTVVPLGASLRFLPLGRRARISPYVAAGGDVFFYKYEARGEFIDFFDDDLPVSLDAFVSEGATPGFHVAGGLRIRVSHDLAVTSEVRYQQARTRMDDDFFENDIDLSGTSVTIGMHLRF